MVNLAEFVRDGCLSAVTIRAGHLHLLQIQNRTRAAAVPSLGRTVGMGEYYSKKVLY